MYLQVSTGCSIGNYDLMYFNDCCVAKDYLKIIVLALIKCDYVQDVKVVFVVICQNITRPMTGAKNSECKYS